MAVAISFALIMRVEMPNEHGAFGVLTNTIGDAGGDVGAVDMRSVSKTHVVRDVTINVSSDVIGAAVRKAVESLKGFQIISISDSTFLAHLGGKISVTPKIPVKTRQDLSTVYTPGVARVSLAIAEDPNKAFQLTVKRNMVAVVSDDHELLSQCQLDVCS